MTSINKPYGGKRQTVDGGASAKVELLQTRLRQLCHQAHEAIDPEEMPTHKQIFIRLQNESMVLSPYSCLSKTRKSNRRIIAVSAIRREAEVRKGGRTSKVNPVLNGGALL
jgi:hypothetical protein